MKKALSVLLLVLLLALPLSGPALAAESGTLSYVMDLDGLLDETQAEALDTAARQISETYDVGVYIGVIPDMRDYNFNNIEECAEEFYHAFELGRGQERNGILLLMSMAERDYDLCAYGEFAHYAFTDYGKTVISDAFLDNFRENDWYGGFFDYLARTEDLLRQARAGDPVDITAAETVRGRITPGGLIVSVILSALAAWGVCGLLKGKMKSVRTAADADSYVPAGGVQFRVRTDHYTHSTRVRRRIESSSRSGGGGGGTSINSGGFSHSSGKF